MREHDRAIIRYSRLPVPQADPMRLIDPSLRFLHCFRRRDYLEGALTQGLMFTDHEAHFRPTDDRDELLALVNEVTPVLEKKLRSIGLPFETLSGTRQQLLLQGLGVARGEIPMICFTEIVPGRDLGWHRQMFGGYGIVPKANWMMRNDAERVLYIGNNSPVSRQIFRIMALTHVLGLHAHDGEPLFDTMTHKTTTPLLSYVEMRDHVTEVEWRIAGETSYFGGTRATGSKIALRMDDLDHVFVADADVAEIQALVDRLALAQACASPSVTAFPEAVPT